jgi:hypothetical protein
VYSCGNTLESRLRRSFCFQKQKSKTSFFRPVQEEEPLRQLGRLRKLFAELKFSPKLLYAAARMAVKTL